MNDDEVLGHLLKIEAEAAALVNDAQAEADRRVAEGEKRNRAEYEERYRGEAGRLEAELRQQKERIQAQYRQELAAYREQLSAVTVDTDRFSALLEELITGAQ
jgi:F0F1-type ATP synthase membrane subunit b/b'